MRVISGTAKGRVLKTPEGLGTRPTADRVKESLFNIISPYVYKSEVLDLFSGSGAIAIEALSRGATFADIVEKAPAAVACIRENLEKTGLKDKAEIHLTDVFAYLGRCNKGYDLIIMDPPYHSDTIEKALAVISERNLLNEGGVVVCECDGDEMVKDTVLDMKLVDTRKYGRVLLNFFKKI